MNKIVVLAAGKGTRMNDELPKVLVPLKGKPMIEYLIKSIFNSGVDNSPVIVVSPDNKELTQNCEITLLPSPKQVAILVGQHIGVRDNNNGRRFFPLLDMPPFFFLRGL